MRCARPGGLTAITAALLLGTAMIAAPLSGQNGRDPLAGLQTPTVPALTILGIEATAIERPTTPAALSTALLAASEQATVIPDNYALEVAPYWLSSHPELLFRDRYAPSFGQLFRQSFAVSVASGKPTGADSTLTRVGVGARVLLAAGRPGADEQFTLDSIQALQLEGVRLNARIAQANTPEERETLEAVRDSLTEIRVRLNQELIRVQQNPPAGLRWEVAMGVAGEFPESTLQGANLSDWGVWSTLAFRPAATDFDLLLLGRFLRKETPDTPPLDLPGVDSIVVEGQNLLDFGGRVLAMLGDLVLSGEVVGRLAFELDDLSQDTGPRRTSIEHSSSVRATANLRYRLTEDLGLSWTFGKDFRSPGSDVDPLIAMLGLNLTLGERLRLPFGARPR